MKKTFSSFLFILIATLLIACGSQTQTQAPTTVQSAPSETLVITPTMTTETPSPTLESASPTVTLTEEAFKVRVSSVNGMPQVYVPAGTLHMGGYDVRSAPDEFPAHAVKLSAFWMDQLEVTNAMYQLCVSAGACTLPQSLGSQRRQEYYDLLEFKDYPVVYVTWGQAKNYCEWAGERLPTEAEWERAARGNDLRTFPWGEDKPDDRFANFNFLVKDTSRVGTYSLGASPFGALDMAGNVAEWTNDFFSATYYASAADMLNPVGPASSSNWMRVVRGGSLGDAEINIRVSKRSSVLGSDLNALKDTKEYLGDFSPRIGFRCATSE